MPVKRPRTEPKSAPKVVETRGRRPTYKDPKEFRTRVDEYFDDCDKNKVFPDEKGMYVFLKIFEEDLEPLLSQENPDAEEYLRILKLAKYRRESWLSRNMVSDNRMTNGCMNALKQEQNGGYTDRPAVDKSKSVRIIMPDGMTVDTFK